MIPYFPCMLWTAAQFDLPPRVLPSIQRVEAGGVGVVHANTNGSEDLGVMQVNSLWIPPLVRRLGVPAKVVRDRLLHDACFNITVAANLVRLYLDQSNGDVMAAVGNYHSHTPIHHQAYLVKVIHAASALFGNLPADKPASQPHG